MRARVKKLKVGMVASSPNGTHDCVVLNMAELSGKIIDVKPLASNNGWYFYKNYKFHESWLDFDTVKAVLVVIKQLRAGEFKVTPEHTDYVSGEMEMLSGEKHLAHPHQDFLGWYTIYGRNFHESWFEVDVDQKDEESAPESMKYASDGSLPTMESAILTLFALRDRLFINQVEHEDQVEKLRKSNVVIAEKLEADIDTMTEAIRTLKRWNV